MNNIKEILNLRGMSINELSKLIEKDYSMTHALVTREDLGSTRLDNLIKVADVLDVDIEQLYSDTGRREIKILRLYNAKYAGGLVVEAIEKFKKEVEEGIKEKINRFSVVTYKYTSDIDIQGVEDKIDLEITVGSKRNDEDRYTFHLKTRSAELIFKTDLINIITLCINECEKGEFDDIKDVWENLSYEGYNHSNVELEKIEIN